MDDWDAADVQPKQGRVENLLYLNDEDEEEGDDPEQEHEGRKVMVWVFSKLFLLYKQFYLLYQI